ncbi:MAG: flavodoxin domain-containing protein [Pseudomonadota bacterium]
MSRVPVRQLFNAAVALLLTLQCVMLSLAVAIERKHIRSTVPLSVSSESTVLTAAPGTHSGTAQEPKDGPKLAPWHVGPIEILTVTDTDGQVFNRIGEATRRSYALFARSADVSALLLLVLSPIGLLTRRLTIQTAGVGAAVAIAYFGSGLGQHLSGASLWLSHAGQLLLIGAAAGAFVWNSQEHNAAGSEHGAAPNQTLLAYASQSGSAQSLAERFLQATDTAVDLHCFSALSMQRLNSYDSILLIASTFGAGEPPDRAQSLVSSLERGFSFTRAPRFAVLALGDSRYEQFCAFGHRLHRLMRDAGAVPLMETTTVNRMDEDTIASWWTRIAGQYGWNRLQRSTPTCTATIKLNECLNPASSTRAVHCVEFDPLTAAAGRLKFSPGDLLEVHARNNSEAVARHLEALSIDPLTTVQVNGQARTLLEAIAEREWREVTACTAQKLLEALPNRSARTFSIASAPADNALRLMVRRRRRPDGSNGLVSNQLCDADPGTRFDVRVRQNLSFRMPAADVPLVMIAAGTGLAPYLGFLSQMRSERRTGESWLFFGEQSSAHDAYFSEQLEGYQHDGTLSRLVTTWSRDTPGSYIQEAIATHRSTVEALVEQKGAHLYLCGAQQGFGSAVLKLLSEWFGTKRYQQLVDEHRLHSDLY